MSVKNDVSLNLLKSLGGGKIVVCRKFTLKVFGLCFIDLDRGRRGLAPSRGRLLLRHGASVASRSFGLLFVCILGWSSRKGRSSFDGGIFEWVASHGLSLNGRFGGYGGLSLCVVFGHVVVKTQLFRVEELRCYVEQVAIGLSSGLIEVKNGLEGSRTGRDSVAPLRKRVSSL